MSAPIPSDLRPVLRDLAARPCRHCRAAVISRPRGLCWHCYYTPGVREQHEPVSKYGRRGTLLTRFTPPLPEPTQHLPGTPGKVDVLIARALANEQLWHPLQP